MADDDFTSGTSMSAQHDVYPQRVLRVAPTDGSTKFNAIRIPLVPVACWRLNDPAFDFDSSFVVPAFRAEIAQLAATLQANPGCRAAIFGHADPAGGDDVNKTISDRRAIAIYALLTRQPPLWEDLYTNPVDGDAWGTRSIQAMLATIVGRSTDDQGNPLAPGSPYYSGTIDDKYGPETTEAVRHFQSAAGLPADGHAGPQTRPVLFGAYMDALCATPPPAATADASGDGTAPAAPAGPFPMKPGDFLGGEGAGMGDLPKMSLQGCSRFNPVVLLTSHEMNGDDKDTRNADDAPNRRVLLLFFAKDTKVNPSFWPCPKVNEPADVCKSAFWPDGEHRRQNGGSLREYKITRDTMACRFYDRFARRSPCESGRYRTFRFALFVENDPWIGAATIRLLRPDGSIAQSTPVSGGRLSGGYREFHFRIQEDGMYSAVLAGDGGTLTLFDATTLSRILSDPDNDGLQHGNTCRWQSDQP